jgi:hypothetical protein
MKNPPLPLVKDKTGYSACENILYLEWEQDTYDGEKTRRDVRHAKIFYIWKEKRIPTMVKMFLMLGFWEG